MFQAEKVPRLQDMGGRGVARVYVQRQLEAGRSLETGGLWLKLDLRCRGVTLRFKVARQCSIDEAPYAAFLYSVAIKKTPVVS